MSAVNVKPEDIDESTAKMAKPEGLALSTAGVSIGSTIEVLWEVELEDGDSESVWWAARVGVDESILLVLNLWKTTPPTGGRQTLER